ncbi:hypothetical protein HPP92_014004 [Vanilla planifolia]|uniref:Protein MAK16 homolog n=1 Tax=Vanilla planifolia TaxID=51239 RepID=A0A835QTK3_VANPL|nr:hypothetical protein HPP92_014004 [Vanilla planifolia]
MTQYRIRMRKLQLKVREKIMTVPRKEKKREARREEKAEKAAVLDKSIEKELLERLKKGVYGDIYNYPVEAYHNVLEMEGLQPVGEEEEEEEPEIEYVEGYDDLEEEADMEDFGGLANKQLLMEHGYDDVDDPFEQMDTDRPSKKQRGVDPDIGKVEKSLVSRAIHKKARVIVEVENDDETSNRQKLQF